MPSTPKILYKTFLKFRQKARRLSSSVLLEKKVVAKIIETVVAMTNTDGGVIILGVDDPEKTKQKGLDRIYGIDENIEVFDATGRELQKKLFHRCQDYGYRTL